MFSVVFAIWWKAKKTVIEALLLNPFTYFGYEYDTAGTVSTQGFGIAGSPFSTYVPGTLQT